VARRGGTEAGVNVVAPFEVGLVVRDIDAVLPFYTGVLGLTVLSDVRASDVVSRAAGLASDGYRVVRLETPRGDRLKLAQAASPADPVAPDDYPLRHPGTAYVTFIVDDLEALHGRLRAAGASIRSAGIVELRAGVTMVLANDPAHHWLEFVHYDDLASYRPVAARA
jgi:catechol 2,3-dioxygenase-like lactoylglutathione lyase family enzyme